MFLFAVLYLLHSELALLEKMGVRRPVSRVLSPIRKPGDDHSSWTSVAGRLARSTRAADRKCLAYETPRRPYSILLPVGFTMPPPLPAARCALTAPFHPCRPCDPMPCGTGHGFGGLLSVALSLRSPSPGVTRHRFPVEPGLSSSGKVAGNLAASGHPAT